MIVGCIPALSVGPKDFWWADNPDFPIYDRVFKKTIEKLKTWIVFSGN
jgi:hypothetical protein